MARNRNKTAAVEEVVLPQQSEPAVPAEAPTLAAVIAKALALCGRMPEASVKFESGNSGNYGFGIHQSFTFSIEIDGLNWSDCLMQKAGERTGQDLESALAAMAERVYAGAAAELAARESTQ